MLSDSLPDFVKGIRSTAENPHKGNIRLFDEVGRIQTAVSSLVPHHPGRFPAILVARRQVDQQRSRVDDFWPQILLRETSRDENSSRLGIYYPPSVLVASALR